MKYSWNIWTHKIIIIIIWRRFNFICDADVSQLQQNSSSQGKKWWCVANEYHKDNSFKLYSTGNDN